MATTLKIQFKLILMNFLYLLLVIQSFLKRRESLQNIKRIGILFLPRLGIGDLVMLSPAIQKIAEIFKGSEIFLITWVEPILDFKGITIIKPQEFKNRRRQFDLLISPTLNLRHLPFVFRAKYWVGYFAKPKIQANFPIKKYSYHLRLEHYLWRGIRLVKALNEQQGNFLEKEAHNKNVVYPELICQEPSYFENSLKEEKYLALAPISKWADRQWPIKNFGEIIRKIFRDRLLTKAVILGDKSEHDRRLANALLENLQDIPKDFFVDAVGKNSLSQTIFLIKNSHLFLGLDSSPAHFACLTSPRALTIFITVDPIYRVPLTKIPGVIRFLCPKNCPKFPCYSGLIPSEAKQCQKCASSITTAVVINEAEQLLKQNP